MPPVPPSQVEPLKVLHARYPLALEHMFGVTTLVARGGIRPGECAANVFDFEDGLRLIVSRELHHDGTRFLHVSASFPAECRIADEMHLLTLTKTREELMEWWRRDVPRRFGELSGDARDMAFIGWSDGGIPHWVIEEASPPAIPGR